MAQVHDIVGDKPATHQKEGLFEGTTHEAAERGQVATDRYRFSLQLIIIRANSSPVMVNLSSTLIPSRNVACCGKSTFTLCRQCQCCIYFASSTGRISETPSSRVSIKTSRSMGTTTMQCCQSFTSRISSLRSRRLWPASGSDRDGLSLL